MGTILKTARIKTMKIKNEMRLYSGREGRGKLIDKAHYWPESYESGSEAMRILMNSAQNGGYERIMVETEYPETEFDCDYRLIDKVWVEMCHIRENPDYDFHPGRETRPELFAE